MASLESPRGCVSYPRHCELDRVEGCRACPQRSQHRDRDRSSSRAISVPGPGTEHRSICECGGAGGRHTMRPSAISFSEPPELAWRRRSEQWRRLVTEAIRTPSCGVVNRSRRDSYLRGRIPRPCERWWRSPHPRRDYLSAGRGAIHLGRGTTHARLSGPLSFVLSRRLDAANPADRGDRLRRGRRMALVSRPRRPLSVNHLLASNYYSGWYSNAERIHGLR